MEEEKLLVGEAMENVKFIRDGDKLIVGDDTQLIVNLKNQRNYIKVQGQLIPYYRKVLFSDDLLAGKRKQVMNTAVRYYYHQACEVAKGLEIAKNYRQRVNTTVREIR